MALAYGWNGQFGWGKESTYGTAVAIDHFLEFETCGVGQTIGRNNRQLIGRGNRRFYDHFSTEGLKDARGPLLFPAQLAGWVELLEGALGSVSTAQQGVTAAFKHSVTVADALPSFTLEVDKGNRTFTYPGCKVARMQIEIVPDAPSIPVTVDWIGNADETDAASPTAATYPTGNYQWKPWQCVMTLGGSAQEFERAVITIENRFNENRYNFQQTRRSLDEIATTDGGRVVTVELTLPFENVTEYDKIDAGTPIDLNWLFTGAEIDASGPFNEELSITLNSVKLAGTAPTIDSPEEIPLVLNGRAEYDGTNSEVLAHIQNEETAA